jgi:hypothetical protein
MVSHECNAMTRHMNINLMLHMLSLPCTGDDASQGLSKKDKRSLQAKDAGGPEAQFFSRIWEMMPTLKVSARGITVALFRVTDGGFEPAADAEFKQLKSPEIEHQALLYYRALGRLFVNCLAMKSAVPDEVLPKLFRNGK